MKQHFCTCVLASVLSVFLFLSPDILSAQTRSLVSLRTVDASTGKSVMGAVIEVYSVDNPSKKRYYTTGADGVCVFGAAVGKNRLEITFLGYEDYRKTIEVGTQKLELGNIRLKESATAIDAVVKEAKQLQTSQNADTLIYNASAFKVAADADAEGLIKKMPGIVVENGAVEAQGETVKKVYVDGQEFFGDDVTTAIKTLPAEAIDKVEVFNKLSDEAEFAGIDDGEGFMALNFVTKKHMRNGTFGKIYAGLGYEPDADKLSFNPKYIAGGNVNYFHGKSRFSGIGLFNNVNQQNFSFEDIVGVSGATAKNANQSVGQYMVRPQDGVATVNSLGFNYSDVWGRKQGVKFQSSYFFNHTGTKNLEQNDTWYEDPSPYGTRHGETLSDARNMNHRLNTRLDWKISRNQALMNRFNVSYQGHRPTAASEGFVNGDTDFSVPAGSSYQGLAYSASSKNNRMRGINLHEFLQYRVRLGKPGRTLTIDGKFSCRSTSSLVRSSQNSVSAIRYTDPEYAVLYDKYFIQGSWRDMFSDPILYDPEYQLKRTPFSSWQLRGSISYYEPITRNLRFTMQYRVGFRHQDKHQNAWYCSDDTYTETGALVNDAMTMSYLTEHMSHRIGPGLRYSKKKTTLSASVYYTHQKLNTSIVGMQGDEIDRKYDNFLYFAHAKIAINSNNNLRLYFRSSVDAPDVTQLQGVFDVSSPRYLEVGNRNLDKTYSHNISLHYVHTATEKGRTLMINAQMTHEQDHISGSKLYNSHGWALPDQLGSLTIPKKKDGNPYRPTELTSYENLDGYWSTSARVTYGFPVSFLKCNLNIAAGIRYSVVPSAVYQPGATPAQLLEHMAAHEYDVNYSKRMSYNVSVVLGSNISEKVDFTLSWRGGYHNTHNTLTQTGDVSSNRYFNHTADAQMKFVIWKGLTLTASALYKQYVGFSNDYNEDLVVCNVFIGKKVCRNQLGEIQLGAYDLFDQNKAFARKVSSGMTKNTIDSAIGRFFMVQFVYNLRAFGVNTAPSKSSMRGRGGYGDGMSRGGSSRHRGGDF